MVRWVQYTMSRGIDIPWLVSKFVYHESDIFLKIGFAEIPFINKGLLVYLVFSIFWNKYSITNRRF
jgi:hypothetical protein